MSKPRPAQPTKPSSPSPQRSQSTSSTDDESGDDPTTGTLRVARFVHQNKALAGKRAYTGKPR